jgi:Fe-S-cluster containining protein
VLKPLPRYGDYIRERSTSNWENYIEALRAAGRAVDVGPIVFDGESVFRRRFTCDTRLCSPTKHPGTGRAWRESGMKSCCAELVVDLAKNEIEALERNWEAVGGYLAERDPFFAGKSARDCMELSSDFEISLKKRSGRCIFALKDGEWGIRCGIHSACLEKGLPLREVKPVVCDTFPLIIMDLTGGRWYVGAHDAESEGIAGLGDYPTETFPCLTASGDGERMYVAMGDTLRAFFGDEAWAKTRAAAEKYLKGPRPKKLKLP